MMAEEQACQHAARMFDTRRASPARIGGGLDRTTLHEIRAFVGAARLDQLLGLLGEELHARPAAIRAALADRDFAAATAEARSLESAAANLGALQVSKAARKLEDRIAAAAQGESGLLAPVLHRLAAHVAEAQQAIAQARLGTAPGLLRA